MKPKNLCPFNLSGLLLVIFALQSCVQKAGTWKNEQINAGKREDFHELNDKVFKAVKANDMLQAKLLMSKELIENVSTIHSVELAGNHLNDHKYRLLDEYYTVNKYKDFDTIQAKSIGGDGYTLHFPGTAREMYIAFYIPISGDNKYMIATTYAKYDYGWKLSSLELSSYTINGKTAPGLFKLAEEQYNKNYLIDAQNTMTLANTCIRPASIWQYPEEGEITDFYSKVSSETREKYKFPLVITFLPTRPMILQVYSKDTEEGYFPLIYYMTHISIKDTNAVKAENIQIKKVLSKVLPGIDKYNKYVFYEAFNKFPNGGESVDRFHMVDQPK